MKTFFLFNILYKVIGGAGTGEGGTSSGGRGRKNWTLPPGAVNPRAAPACPRQTKNDAAEQQLLLDPQEKYETQQQKMEDPTVQEMVSLSPNRRLHKKQQHIHL